MIDKVEKVIRYFDLASEARPTTAQATNDKGKSLHWLPQYLALLIGWEFGDFWGWVAASGVLATMALPAVYKRAFDPEKPLFVQLCVIFTSGIGWHSLVKVASTIGEGA
jgi:hypothetical protein